MYRELTADTLMGVLGLSADEVPHGLILVGKMDFPGVLTEWRERLENARTLRFFHMLLGTYREKRVMFAVTYGAALTSEVVHIAGVMGVPLVVQLGSFGGLQRGMNVGDLFFPTVAGRGDAASDSYLAPDEPADASPDLLAWMRDQAQQRGMTTHTGSHYTTAAMLGETREDIARWNAQGYCGVDLETATTFAVARHFGMRRVAALALIDNLIEDHSIMDVTVDQRTVYKQTQDVTAQLALDTIIEWGGAPAAPTAPLEAQEAHELALRLRDETTDTA